MADYWISTFGGSGDDRGNALAVDPLGGVYFCGQSPIRGTGGDDALLTKYNNSGGIEWQRLLGGTGNERGRVVAVDASRNVYVAGLTTSAGAGYDDALIAKYNSAGALQWQRTLGGTGYENAYAMGIDSSNNVYVIGATLVGGPSYDVLIAKYNSAGTLQWQRVLGIAANGEYGYGIAVDSASGHFYITGFTTSVGAGGWDAFVAKFPVSGSGIGTFGIWTYQESTLTAATSNLTANSGLTTSAGASSFSNGTATLTDTPVIQTFPIA